MARYGNSIDDNYSYVEDETDLEFLKGARRQKFREIEERAIKSSEASINILRETEEIGNRTAEELVAQREQLERSEKRLDNINATLRFSQKHIQGIKSIFGSLKNYLSGTQTDPTQNKGGEGGEPSASTSSDNPTSPTTEWKKSSFEDNNFGSSSSGLQFNKSLDEDEGKPQRSAMFSQTNKVLDDNIDEISSSLSRLKGLSLGLSDEIETQNTILDRMNDKSDRADVQLNRQEREIRRLLK